MEKERLDVLLVKKGFFQSRERARSAIMAGIVYVEKQKADKPGTSFNVNSEIEVRENVNPYVSRGGLKLEKALKAFNLQLKDKVAIDIGASTGGFTDCMLKNGARKVFSIDVGYGQLAWELRNDERVVCMERTNIRYVKPQDLGEAADFASIDVSFISLKKVLPAARELLNSEGEIVCLIKPQFEAGREKVGKHGVVRDSGVHKQVIEEVIEFAIQTGFGLKDLSFSPIKGPEGNIEYLLYISKNQGNITEYKDMLENTVQQAHNSL